MITTPVTDYARRFAIRSTPEQVESALADYVLHASSNSQTRTVLRPLVYDAPKDIGEILCEMRSEHDFYVWKLAALRYLQGDKTALSNYVGGPKQLQSVNVPRIKRIEQSLHIPDGEKTLSQAMQDLMPVINNLYYGKVRFIDTLMQGHSMGMLSERAVATFRWEYPFTRNPGACMNTAVSNYALNMARDMNTESRRVFTGMKRDGNLTSMLSPLLTDAEDVHDRPFTHDINVDYKSLSEMDQKIIHTILTSVDSTGDDLVCDLCEALDLPEHEIQSALSRIGAYLHGSVADIHEVNAHYWD